MAARNDTCARRDYSTITPRLVPDFFFINKRCQIAVIYDEDLGESSRDTVTLMFSGGHPGAAPIRVVPERVGTRTLLLESPVYSRVPPTGTVSVLPILHTKQSTGYGDVDLKSFEVKVQDPARSLIQMCLQVFPSEEMLPVFITLMLRSKGDKNAFQEPQFDKVMATLVAGRDPQSSNSIKDILLPAKKWQRMTLHEFSKAHTLPNTAEASKVKESRRLGRRITTAPQPARNEQNLQSIYANVQELQPSPARDRVAHNPEDNVYENPIVPPTTAMRKPSKSSNSSLMGEPINLENPPSHYLNPPGSGTESDSEAYSNMRRHSDIKQHYSDTDTPPPTKFRPQRQQYTDSMDSGLNRIHQHSHPETSPYRRQQNTSHAPSTTGLSPLMLRTAVGHQPQNIRDYPQPPPRQQHASGRAHHRDDTDTLGGERRPQPFEPEHRPVPAPRHNLAKVNRQPPLQQTVPVPTEISNTEDLYDDIVHAYHQTDVPHSAVAASPQSGSSHKQPPRVVPRRPSRGLDKLCTQTGAEAKQW